MPVQQVSMNGGRGTQETTSYAQNASAKFNQGTAELAGGLENLAAADGTTGNPDGAATYDAKQGRWVNPETSFVGAGAKMIFGDPGVTSYVDVKNV